MHRGEEQPTRVPLRKLERHGVDVCTARHRPQLKDRESPIIVAGQGLPHFVRQVEPRIESGEIVTCRHKRGLKGAYLMNDKGRSRSETHTQRTSQEFPRMLARKGKVKIVEEL